MEGIAQAFDALLKQGILPAAFIIGSIAFFVALIGKIPVGNGHDIPIIPRIFLGLFGFTFAITGIGGALFGIFAVTKTPPSSPTQQPDIVAFVTATPPVQPTTMINTAISRPETLAEIELSPASEEGSVFPCEQSGQYIITIVKGLYSPWSGGTGGQWRSFFTIYRNEPANWGKNQFGYVVPMPGNNETTGIGLMERPNQTETQAEQAAIGLSTAVSCLTGEYLRFVGADERGSYTDNFGSVTVRIDILQ